MRHFRHKQTIWTFGLDEALIDTVSGLAGTDRALRSWTASALDDFVIPALEPIPSLVCFSKDAYGKFASLPRQTSGFLEMVPKTLFLNPDDGPEIVEQAIDQGLADIIRLPLTPERFSRTLDRADEAAALQRDIRNMAHEVYAEREMLERKNQALSFLVNFMTHVSDAVDQTDIITRAFSALQGLFPVVTMHAALFSVDDRHGVHADIFIASAPESDQYHMWRSRLLELAGVTPGLVVRETSQFLSLNDEKALRAGPLDGHIVSLPMQLGANAHFYLMLLTPMERNLSRDQTLALDSAMRHMALSMRNVRRVEQLCHFADRDCLSGLYNRRFFEQSLQNEVARQERYEGELALVFLDIDNFKSINDRWGHLKGDEVLRAVAECLRSTARKTDFCARYGGEEFAIIMPATSRRNAASLAERIRRKVEDLSFQAGDASFSVTLSAGVTSLAADQPKDARALSGEADAALYRAKNLGRNQVALHDGPGVQDLRFSTQANQATSA